MLRKYYEHGNEVSGLHKRRGILYPVHIRLLISSLLSVVQPWVGLGLLALISLYQINADKCSLILLDKLFIKTLRHSDMFHLKRSSSGRIFDTLSQHVQEGESLDVKLASFLECIKLPEDGPLKVETRWGLNKVMT